MVCDRHYCPVVRTTYVPEHALLVHCVSWVSWVFRVHLCQIPYSCEVLMDNFKERKSETVLDATIVVSQESQKGMVIGKKGAKIKEVGIKARNVRYRSTSVQDETDFLRL